MSRRWLLVPVAASIAAASCFLRTSPPPVAAVPTPPALPMPEGLTGDFFGINEALSVPSALVFSQRVSGPQQRGELEEDARGAVALGAALIRANSHTYPFFNQKSYTRTPIPSRERSDRYFEVLAQTDLELVAVIGPWPGIQTANHTDAYLPADMVAYTRFVEEIVERYDGDGVEDAPGLSRGVAAWEIDNEPDLHNRVPARGAKRDIDPATFQTPAEYAEVLLQTAAAIRRADPDATILSAGMYNVRASAGEDYLSAVLSVEGVLDAVDAIALHCYSDDDSLTAIEQTLAIGARLAPGKPIWITETGVASQGSHPWQSEAWQATMVVGIHAAALLGGAERLLWHTLSDPPPRKGRALPFDHHSLMTTRHSTWDGGEGPARVNKPAGDAYARLTARLAEVPRSALAEVPTTDGRLMSAGDSLLAFWGTPQLPDGDWVIEDLITGAELDEPVAPAWISPRPGE